MDYLYAGAVGALRGIGSLPIEHPLELVKTRMQSTNYTARAICKEIYQSSGIRGYYVGVGANCVKHFVKQGIRFPLILWSGSFFNGDTSSIFNNIKSGVFISAIETFAICPIERFKIWLMTAPVESRSISQFFGNEVFAGLSALFFR
jgi:hypothetical protein